MSSSSASTCISPSTANFDTAYAPQYARPLIETPLVVNTIDGSRRLDQQRQQRPGQDERRVDVDVHDLEPRRHVVMRDRRAVTEQRGDVGKAVEPAEFLADRLGQRVVCGGVGLFEVERRDRRPRAAGGDDRVVNRLELASRTARSGHLCAEPRAALCERAADAATRAGDQDHAVGERVASSGRTGAGRWR